MAGEKLKRQKGDVPIEHDSEEFGVAYDSGLFDEDEILEFYNTATSEAIFGRMVALSEVQRASRYWPVCTRMGKLLSNQQWRRAFELLEHSGLEETDPEWLDVESRKREAEARAEIAWGEALDAVDREDSQARRMDLGENL